MTVRVLYYYSGSQFDTGSAKALVGLVEHLDRSCFEPVFLARSDGPLVEALAMRGVEIVRGRAASISYRRPLKGFAHVWRQARALRSLRIDLVHVNEFGWNLDLVLGAWTRGIPVILHVHNPVSVDLRNLNRVVARKVLVVSEAQKSAIRHFDRIEHKCEVLPNPVDLVTFSRGKSIRPSLGLADDQLVVGTVAQVRRGKGIDTILDLAQMLLPAFPQLVFMIAGPVGHDEVIFGQQMAEMARDPAFGGRVRFLGPRTDVSDLLASMDVFLLPTRAETFGIGVVEAMAAGVPVVASDVGGIREIISSPDLGWKVPPDSVAGFADALRTVLQLPDRGRAAGERGRRSLSGRFDAQTVQRRLEGVYRRLVSCT